MSKSTSFGKTPQSICNPDGSWIGLAGGSQTAYENHEWATGIVNDYNMKVGQTAFGTVTTARFVSIRTDAAISVKFNLTTNNSVSIAANTSFSLETLEVTNIFCTAVASANVKIFLT
jgi:hypothetical protein